MNSEERQSRYQLAFPTVMAVGLHAVLAALVLVGFSVTHPNPDRFQLPPTLTANLMMEPRPQPVRKPQPAAQPQAQRAPEPQPQPAPQPRPEPAPVAKPDPAPQPTPAPQPKPAPQPTPTPQPQAAAPKPSTPAPAAEAKPAPSVNSDDVFSDMLEGLDNEDELLAQRQEELAAAEAQRELDAQVTSTYTDRIYQQISRAWSRPMELQIMDLTGRETVVQVSLLPTGELLSAEIISSSGISALDQSAIRAVQRVRRYQVPEDINLFNRNFRSFRFRFKPEDLL